MSLLSGNTTVLSILGDPITQVALPRLFTRYAVQQSLDATLIPIHLAAADLPSFARMLRGWRNSSGCVLTYPHKQAAAALVDQATPIARRLGVVNLIRREPDGRLIGHLTDGIGFLVAAHRHGFTPKGRRALVIGAGGSGSAIAYALADAGLEHLAVLDLIPARRNALLSLLAKEFCDLDLAHTPPTHQQYDLIVNATSVGADGQSLPLSLAAYGQPKLVADVVTEPDITPLLAAARALGCAVQTGKEMAHGQIEAIAQFFGLLGDTSPTSHADGVFSA
ncbi:MAG: shikimate dehydrogenase [Burkholderiales bacterium]|nr:shikimate dehydrogenase [Burkholderiales bacterium]